MAVATPSALITILARGPSSAGELAQAIGVTQPTISRLLRPLERSGQVVRLGSTRGARYGLGREVGAVGRSWPLYRIDEAGAPEEVASVHAIERERYFVRGGPARIQGGFEGIPYYLQDARPAGFLGRAIPTAYPELGLPPRVVDWTDAHVLTYLTQRGSESVGNLILGAEAIDRYLRADQGSRIVTIDQRPRAYPSLALDAMFGAPPGSSAHGEHPKFSARLQAEGARTHVLVKFSPPRTDAIGMRWADLLIAEHLASVVLHEDGIPVAHTELLEFGDQVFLQSQRFDRVGDHGRRGVASLWSVGVAFHGELDAWSAAASRLRAEGFLTVDDSELLVLLDTFGALIANTDRHFGNITLFDNYEGPFTLAPVYDMLPMLFAPQDGQLLNRTYAPPAPTAASLAVWPRARELAEVYWARLAEEPRLSADFRLLSAQALDAVRALPRRGSPRSQRLGETS